jgi:hypothetical protein
MTATSWQAISFCSFSCSKLRLCKSEILCYFYLIYKENPYCLVANLGGFVKVVGSRIPLGFHGSMLRSVAPKRRTGFCSGRQLGKMNMIEKKIDFSVSLVSGV